MAPGREITADDTLALALIRAAPIFSSVLPWMWHEHTNTKSSYTQNSLLRKSSPVAVNIWCFDYKHDQKKQHFIACTINKESMLCVHAHHRQRKVLMLTWKLRMRHIIQDINSIISKNEIILFIIKSTTQWYCSSILITM